MGKFIFKEENLQKPLRYNNEDQWTPINAKSWFAIYPVKLIKFDKNHFSFALSITQNLLAFQMRIHDFGLLLQKKSSPNWHFIHLPRNGARTKRFGVDTCALSLTRFPYKSLDSTVHVPSLFLNIWVNRHRLKKWR